MTTKLAEKKKDLNELQDTVENCATKICFMAEFFTFGKPDYNFEISARATTGIFHILTDIEQELDMVVDGMSEIESNPESTKRKIAASAES